MGSASGNSEHGPRKKRKRKKVQRKPSKRSQALAITHAKKRALIDAFRTTGNVLLAAQAAGVHRRRHYQWMKCDTRYATDFDDAINDACDILEAEARRRAVHGVDKPVYGNLRGEGGENLGTGQVGVIREYSDTLLIFLLKGRRPDIFREQHEVFGEVRSTVEHEVTFKVEFDSPPMIDTEAVPLLESDNGEHAATA